MDFSQEDFDNLIINSPSQIHYIRNVIRLKLSDVIRIFNEIVGEYAAKVVACDKKEIKLEIIEDISSKKPLHTPNLSIAPSIIKNDKFTDLIDASIQQGTTEIFPLITEYTNFKKLPIQRIERIITEATEQSERFDKATLHPAIKLQELDYSTFEAVIFANEKSDVDEVCDCSIFKKENILLLTGPEGGFSQEELNFLQNLPNSCSISLGARILRAETAINCLISYTNFVRHFSWNPSKH